MKEASRAALAFPLPGLDHDAVDAGIVQSVAQVDEMAFGCFDIELDLLVLDVFEFGGGVSLIGCRHLGIGESHGKSAEDGIVY